MEQLNWEWIADIISGHAGHSTEDRFSQVLHEDNFNIVAKEIAEEYKRMYFKHLDKTEDI